MHNPPAWLDQRVHHICVQVYSPLHRNLANPSSLLRFILIAVAQFLLVEGSDSAQVRQRRYAFTSKPLNFASSNVHEVNRVSATFGI
jgi:hypothetical protein